MSNGDVIYDLHLNFIHELSHLSNINEKDPSSDEVLPAYMGELNLNFNSSTNLFELDIIGELDIHIKSEKYSCVQFPFDENLLK